MLYVSALSTEYVLVKVKAVVNGSEADPTADIVQMAFMPEGTQPALTDWHSGSWETDSTTVPATYYARVLVGPSVIPLTVQTLDAWVKISDNPEIPARRVGNIQVY